MAIKTRSFHQTRSDLAIGAMTFLLYALLAFTFISCLALNNIFLLHPNRTTATTLLTFVVMILAMHAVYGGFDVGRKKSKPVISAMITGTVITDLVSYLQMEIMNVNDNLNDRLILFGPDLLYLLMAMVIQIGIIILFVRLGNDLYFHFHPPRSVLIILGRAEQEAPLRSKIGRYRLQWKVEDVAFYNDPDIGERIRQSEVVFLGEIPEASKVVLLNLCYKYRKDIMCKAQLQETILCNSRPAIVDDAPFLEIEYYKMSFFQRAAKRMGDILISSLCLLLLSPAMLLIAVAIMMEDGRPVIFRQKRLTIRGWEFTIYKFRTMKKECSLHDSQVPTEANDPRITRVGRFLRRFRLDEIPQFVNVLRGQMSIVGPRPEMLSNIDRYKAQLPAFVYREKMKAGITGYAQIEGRYNTTPEDKLMLDLMYIESFSVWLDVKLMLRTVTVLFKRDSTQGFTAPPAGIAPAAPVPPGKAETETPEKKKEIPGAQEKQTPKRRRRSEKTMNTTLLIMAAGLGSRYGGNKQIDRIGPNGEILMEYSIHDAVEAGFDKVVFVIRRSMADQFREMIGDKIAKKVRVEYAFQEYDSLPGGFQAPADRTKPYGTVHAVTCAKDVIHEPFAVINADDYYGRDAFSAMAESLHRLQNAQNKASMVAYYLKNTVSENGHVTRGVCSKDQEGNLVKVTETYKILPFPDGTIRDINDDPEGVILDPNALVSMNFWGFAPSFFEAGEKYLSAFLKSPDGDPLKKEYVLPALVDTLMHEQGLKVEVLSTDAVWFGVTYKEDKAYVAGELKKLHDNGSYPAAL